MSCVDCIISLSSLLLEKKRVEVGQEQNICMFHSTAERADVYFLIFENGRFDYVNGARYLLKGGITFIEYSSDFMKEKGRSMR
ncbi:hypothetical protein SDJN02_02404, partial [Cucurbita argyrosperma subsp. argyrosperma]